MRCTLSARTFFGNLKEIHDKIQIPHPRKAFIQIGIVGDIGQLSFTGKGGFFKINPIVQDFAVIVVNADARLDGGAFSGAVFSDKPKRLSSFSR